jgi:hypothetical protein
MKSWVSVVNGAALRWHAVASSNDLLDRRFEFRLSRHFTSSATRKLLSGQIRELATEAPFDDAQDGLRTPSKEFFG